MSRGLGDVYKRQLSGGSISIMLKKKVLSMMRAVYGLKSGRPLSLSLIGITCLNRPSMQV